jgi:MFS family permease
MNKHLLKILTPIAAIFSFRMLGLFMLIPVFTIYATTLEGANATLIGVALGAYGLSQGIMQIPFGLLSDKYGRKPMLTLGLLLFAIGSLVGALSHSITGMIIARCIQGTGAIGSVLIALLSDLTAERQRTFAMAILGMSIGLSFTIAFIVSPILASYAGLSGIFYFTVFLAILALILVHTVIPIPPETHASPQQQQKHRQRLKHVLMHRELQRLNWGIFCQHFILTSTFFVIPIQLRDQFHFEQGTTWTFYLPVLVIAFLLMLPVLFISEKKQQTQRTFIGAICITTICQIGWLLQQHHWYIFAGLMIIYFTSFNILEAMLPSLISKKAPTENKGTAMGVYSSSQFLGIFAGGASAGILYQFYQENGVFFVNIVLTVLWFISARPSKATL